MPRTVLITGATAGIGRAAARMFVADGWTVIGTGRREARLQELRDELGETFHPLAFDISDPAQIKAAVAGLSGDLADVDLLINNAGLALGTTPVPDVDLDQWVRMIDTNVTGLTVMTHELLPTLIVRNGGIINVASIAGNYAYPGGNVYGATKAFVRQLSLNLRADLWGTGVRVTVLEPGMTETEFTLVRTNGDKSSHDKLYNSADPLTAEDMAETLLWIASRPAHVNVNTLEVMPVSQSFAGIRIHHTT